MRYAISSSILAIGHQLYALKITASCFALPLIREELFDLSLYKSRRGTDPPQSGPFVKRREALTVLLPGAIQEIESQPKLNQAW